MGDESKVRPGATSTDERRDVELTIDQQIDEGQRSRKEQEGEAVPGPAKNDEELKSNRERLGVNEEHQTPDMEKRHRGTFP